MRKGLLGLSLLGAMLLPATAQASVSPEEQDRLDQRGYTVEYLDENLPPEPMLQSHQTRCSQHIKSKRIGSWVRNWNDNRMAGARVRVTACAKNGRIVWKRTSYSLASPGHKWFRVWGPYPTNYSNGIQTRQEFVDRSGGASWVDQFHLLRLRLRAFMVPHTEHVFRFIKTRHWSWG